MKVDLAHDCDAKGRSAAARAYLGKALESDDTNVDRAFNCGKLPGGPPRAAAAGRAGPVVPRDTGTGSGLQEQDRSVSSSGTCFIQRKPSSTMDSPGRAVCRHGVEGRRVSRSSPAA